MGSDEQAIRDVHSTWIEAVNAGDLARLLTMVADDVVFIGPDREPFGVADFRAGFTAAHRDAGINCVSELTEVVVVGEVAYARSRDALVVTPRVGGRPSHHAGHRMTVYRKHADGRWLLARDAHTLSATAE